MLRIPPESRDLDRGLGGMGMDMEMAMEIEMNSEIASVRSGKGSGSGVRGLGLLGVGVRLEGKVGALGMWEGCMLRVWSRGRDSDGRFWLMEMCLG